MLTVLKERIYKEAEATFEEYGDGSLECDALDNLHDLLKVAPESFFEQFEVSYDTETEEWDEEDLDEYDPQPITYVDPKIIFTPKKDSVYCEHKQFHVSCRGFEFSWGDGIECEVNANNEEAARRFYNKYYKT